MYGTGLNVDSEGCGPRIVFEHAAVADKSNCPISVARRDRKESDHKANKTE